MRTLECLGHIRDNHQGWQRRRRRVANDVLEVLVLLTCLHMLETRLWCAISVCHPRPPQQHPRTRYLCPVVTPPRSGPEYAQHPIPSKNTTTQHKHRLERHEGCWNAMAFDGAVVTVALIHWHCRPRRRWRGGGGPRSWMARVRAGRCGNPSCAQLHTSR